jgi:hypothetical protein
MLSMDVENVLFTHDLAKKEVEGGLKVSLLVAKKIFGRAILKERRIELKTRKFQARGLSGSGYQPRNAPNPNFKQISCGSACQLQDL